MGWSWAGEPGGLPSALPSAWASGSQGASPLLSGLLGVDLWDPVAESQTELRTRITCGALKVQATDTPVPKA